LPNFQPAEAAHVPWQDSYLDSHIVLQPIRNIAFHPSETMVAAGDASGRILAWYDVGALRDAKDREQPASTSASDKSLHRRILKEGRAGFEGRTSGQLIGSPRAGGVGNTRFGKGGVRLGDDASALSTWHWHASAVGTLVFSEDGAYVLSGGEEAVLVLWQVETGVKQFLPRMGAPIRFIAGLPDPTVFAVSTTVPQLCWSLCCPGALFLSDA
jgi:NET1-associated nuclear protein 1 (U3 small nucleolar RNA-associated protein 17)